MKSRLVVLTFLLSAYLTAAVTSRVTFVIQAPNLPDTVKVYITGNHRQLGNWHPAKVALQHSDKGTFRRTFEFPIGTALEYKFTLGSWASEARGSAGQILPNFTLTVTCDTLLCYPFTQWSKAASPAGQRNVRGTLRFHHQIHGFGLLPREVVVCLPPDYTQDTTRRYPVLYMHDGQNLFDADLAAFGTEWRADETADSLVRRGLIEPLIIVGIYNTPNRTREYGPTSLGKKYRQFVIETVKPLIDANYRTLPDRQHTATGGSSMGGLVAFTLVWENPTVFSKAICMSPAFKIDRLDYVKTVRKSRHIPQEIRLYIDNGGLDLETRLQPGIEAMLATLNALGFAPNRDYYWRQDPQARHHESAWAQRFPQALQWLFPAKP